jgi:uncharacterized protein YprB with RNaseH-like and TPR domain
VNLGDRVRGIVKPAAPVPETPPGPVSGALALDEVLRGDWHADRSCYLVEERVPASALHGRRRVGDLAARLAAAAGQASLLARGAPARPPFVFFDLETTGLSGGAGTYAFLVGCGAFAGDGAFVTRQFVMTAFAGERPMLETVARELQDAGALVSFNGKSFDAPVLETRYLYHRLEWAAARLPHLDALHSARLFWGEPDLSCTLAALETQVLGARRQRDIAGFEIPARYFQFVRTGDARPLAAVLEHNRLDLLSLAGLTARLLELVAGGADEAVDAREALALGRVYGRAGLDGRAREALVRAIEMTAGVPPGGGSSTVRAAALHALALCERRARRYEAAAATWRAMLDLPDCPPRLAREATEALAIHHEHRVRDLSAARVFALRSLNQGAGPAWQAAVVRRLTRIDRKLERSERSLWE